MDSAGSRSQSFQKILLLYDIGVLSIFIFFSELFLDNVFKQIAQDGIQITRNQTISRVVENLLKQATSVQHLESIGSILSTDWELACTDRFEIEWTKLYHVACHSWLSWSKV